MWRNGPKTKEWGDSTWSAMTMGWLGAYVVKSNHRGATWSQPIPVNVRPLKHGGCLHRLLAAAIGIAADGT